MKLIIQPDGRHRYPSDSAIIPVRLFWSDIIELDMVRARKVAGLRPKKSEQLLLFFVLLLIGLTGIVGAIKMNTEYLLSILH